MYMYVQTDDRQTDKQAGVSVFEQKTWDTAQHGVRVPQTPDDVTKSSDLYIRSKTIFSNTKHPELQKTIEEAESKAQR